MADKWHGARFQRMGRTPRLRPLDLVDPWPNGTVSDPVGALASQFAIFPQRSEAATLFPESHVATLEWANNADDAYRMRLVGGGCDAFDKVTTLREVHEHILNWYAGDAAFDGVV